MNKKCQVFTPEKIVKDILDYAQYSGARIIHKRVLENSCGDGNFLVEIVRRYIEVCLPDSDTDKIHIFLEKYIWGIEVDSEHLNNCRIALDRVAAEYKIYHVQWNLLCQDALSNENDLGDFDYIIGNPPYITYAELDTITRKFIKQKFKTCKRGKPDYYYAFIEAAIAQLRDQGTFAYLIPSNIFKTRFAADIRALLLPYLVAIYDYGHKKLFDDKLTSSAVIVLQKGKIGDQLQYRDLSSTSPADIIVNKNELESKWFFDKIQQPNNSPNAQLRFGDFFRASCSVATLCNDAFICQIAEAEDSKLEKGILRLAASPKALSKKRKEFIIFPYYYRDGKLCKYTENEFENQFPHAFFYLHKFKEKLLKRDADKGATWFQFGRSQALRHLDQEKLLLSTLITGKVKVYDLESKTIPYSGIFIVPKGKLSLTKGREILESIEFLKYVEKIGIRANGNSIRISAKDIADYRFTMENL